MLIILKKLKITLNLTAFLPLSLLVLCLLLASCYTLYPAPSGTSGTPGTGNTTAQTQQGGNSTASSSAVPVFTPPPLVTGTVVPGDTLTEKFAWLQRSAESHNTYILEVTANENIAPQTLEYRGAINITIALRGIEENRTLRLSTNGTMFDIRTNVTFILEENITLQGHPQNTATLVYANGGILKMNTGSTIYGNSINSNYAGGGVTVINGASFEMMGGTITGNTSPYGGGVYVYAGTFTMRAGSISDNIAIADGGGVYVSHIFEMNGGTISGNTAGNRGGGVYNTNTFNMRGGIITGNSAASEGGGVYCSNTTFTKTGGTITGYSSDPNSGNAVMDEVGNVLARRGHAVFFSSDRRRETTAGPGVNLSNVSTAGWEQ